MYREINTYFPKEQIHFLLFEDLKQDQVAYIKSYYDILGLEVTDNLKLNAHRNESLTEQEIKRIKNLNRFKCFKKGGWFSRKEADLIKRIAKRKQPSKEKVADFQWGNTPLFKGWEADFYKQNQFLADKQIVDSEKLKAYGYIL